MRPPEIIERPDIAAPLEGAIALTEQDFALVCHLIASYAGIKLNPHKRYMVYNRLNRRVRACALGSFAEYLALVQAEPSGEREAFVNALTTNLTSFFRESHHFDILLDRAKAHHAATTQPMRVWCAACSTGEEAWSLAMTLAAAECPADILATDIDTDALAKASAGVYRDDRVSALPPETLRAWWRRGVGSNSGWSSVRPELRDMVTFAPFNLQSLDWPSRAPFDAVFCRNVVIYFDAPAQRRLLEKLTTVMRPGALLAVGHAESFPARHPAFRSCGRTAYVYQPH